MGSNTVIKAAVDSKTVAINVTASYPMFGNLNAPAAETQARMRFRTAGSLSHLYARVLTNTVTATSTIKILKAGVAATQTLSIGSGATGEFEDTTHTDTVAIADDWDFQIVAGATGTSILFSQISCLFVDYSGTNTTSKLATESGSSLSVAGTTSFFPLGGDGATPPTVETFAKCRQRIAGTMKNLAIFLTANTRSDATTVKSRLNGADGTLTMSVGAAGTGIFEDTTHSDAIAIADDYNFAVVTGAGTGALTPLTIAVDFVTTTGEGQGVVAKINAPTAVADATTMWYHILGGSCIPVATEANMQMRAREAFTLEQLGCMISQNDDSAGGTLTLRKNGANGNQTVAITGSTTGWFGDTTNTDVLVTTDEVNAQFTATTVGGAHTITPTSISVWTSAAAVIVTKPHTVFVEWEES